MGEDEEAGTALPMEGRVDEEELVEAVGVVTARSRFKRATPSTEKHNEDSKTQSAAAKAHNNSIRSCCGSSCDTLPFSSVFVHADQSIHLLAL